MFGKKLLKQKIEELEIERDWLSVQKLELDQQVEYLTHENNSLRTHNGTIPDLEYIEVYMFNLLRFICTTDFIELKSDQQDKIMKEFDFIKNCFTIIKNFFKSKEQIIAYQTVEGLDKGFVYSFSTVEVASSVLDCKLDQIIQCLNGSLKVVNGYKFEYESDWKKSESIESEYTKLPNPWK